MAIFPVPWAVLEKIVPWRQKWTSWWLVKDGLLVDSIKFFGRFFHGNSFYQILTSSLTNMVILYYSWIWYHKNIYPPNFRKRKNNLYNSNEFVFSKKSLLFCLGGFWNFPNDLDPFRCVFPLRWCLYRLQYPCPVRCGHRFGPRWWHGTCQAGKWNEEMDWWNDTLMAKESWWCVFWVTFFYWCTLNFRQVTKSDLTTCFHGGNFLWVF